MRVVTACVGGWFDKGGRVGGGRDYDRLYVWFGKTYKFLWIK